MLVKLPSQFQVNQYNHTSKVRHVLNASTVVRLRAFVPDIAQLAAIPTSQLDRVQELRRLETSRTDKQIIVGFDNIRLAVFADNANAVRANAVDGSGLERDVRQGESGVVVVGDDDSLAAGVVFGGQLLPQVRAVGELRLHHLFALASQLFCKRVLAVDDGVVEGFAEVHHCCATAPADRWDVFVDAAPEGCDRGVSARDDPVGSALEYGDALGHFGDFGGNLGGRATFVMLERRFLVHI